VRGPTDQQAVESDELEPTAGEGPDFIRHVEALESHIEDGGYPEGVVLPNADEAKTRKYARTALENPRSSASDTNAWPIDTSRRPGMRENGPRF